MNPPAFISNVSRTALALLGTASAVAAFAGTASAASLDAAGTHIVAFADTRPIPAAVQLAAEEKTLRQTYCTGKGESAKTVTLTAALTAARRLVAGDSHGGQAALASSSAGRSEDAAVAAAAGAVGKGAPAAGLAALLRAHQLASKDPVPLIDAAPLLSDAGLGNEALAMLSAAKKLRLPQGQPFGIGWPAVIDADTGQAKIVTHQYGSAVIALQAAVRAAPLLTEADQSLAVALDCQGNAAKSQRYLVAAVRRQEFPAGDNISGPGDPPELDPVDVLDTSQGQVLRLEGFRVPANIADGHAESRWFGSYAQQQLNRATRLDQQFASDQAELFSKLDKESPATQARTMEIEQAVGEVGNEPNLLDLQRTAGNANDSIDQIVASAEGPSGCMDGGASDPALIKRLVVADTAWRNYATALYARQTALAANLEDPLALTVALDQAEYNAQANFNLLIAAWVQVTGYDALCDSSNPPGFDPENAQRSEPPSNACPSGLDGIGFTLNLYVLEFKVQCEKVTIEGTVGEGWLSAFVRVERDFGKHTTTIFGGAKAGFKESIGPLSGGVTGRGGVYVTFGSDGSVQDVGVRGTTSASLKLGAGGVSISGGDVKLSFVAGL